MTIVTLTNIKWIKIDVCHVEHCLKDI